MEIPIYVLTALFVGGWNGESMVLERKWGGPLVRVTYTVNADGSVRQFGEQSTDGDRAGALVGSRLPPARVTLEPVARVAVGTKKARR